MSDRILLQNMMFYGFHGVHEYEREQGQKFYVDIEIKADLKGPSISDNIMETLDYTVVYSKAKEIIENYRFQLLEAAGAKIASEVLKMQQAREVCVRIRKPSVPIPGALDYVQVEVNRSKEE